MIGLAEIVAGVMALALNAYALTGGADFGGGLWDLLARGPRRNEQRSLIASSLAPIWEANHVWLIVVVVVLFTGFPTAFSALVIVLHIPLTVMLVGIVLRGSAFVFRSYGSRTDALRRGWGATFAVASTITPIVLGTMIGAVASGEVGRVSAGVGRRAFVETFVAPWLAPFPVVVGLFALVLFVYLAAVYLAYAAREAALRDDFRLRALAAAAATFILAAIALVLSRTEAPRIVESVAGSAIAIPLQLATAIAAVTAISALWRRRYGVARIAAAAQVTFIFWGWVWSQYPFIVPTTLTIHDAAAPRETLVLLLVGLIVGTAILLPALRYLFGIFGKPGANEATQTHAT